MPREGKQLLLQTVREGKGFIGIRTAIDTFPGYEPYGRMLGIEQQGRMVANGRKRPGVLHKPWTLRGNLEGPAFRRDPMDYWNDAGSYDTAPLASGPLFSRLFLCLTKTSGFE